VREDRREVFNKLYGLANLVYIKLGGIEGIIKSEGLPPRVEREALNKLSVVGYYLSEIIPMKLLGLTNPDLVDKKVSEMLELADAVDVDVELLFKCGWEVVDECIDLLNSLYYSVEKYVTRRKDLINVINDCIKRLEELRDEMKKYGV